MSHSKSCRIRTSLTILSLVAAALVLGSCARGWDYPQARKADVVDNYHGTEVADPYRWLEDPDSEETMKWVEAENNLTAQFVYTGYRQSFRDRYEKILNYPRYSVPRHEGGRYFFERNDGLQEQSVVYMLDSLGSKPREVMDPNKFSTDGTVAIGTMEFSRDGRYVAYGRSTHGSDWQDVHIRNIDSSLDYDDVLYFCRWPSIAWSADSRGFYYDRLPDSADVPPEDRNNYTRVYWHTLGTPQQRDTLVYERPKDKELWFTPEMSDGGRFLVLRVGRGTSRKYGLMYHDLQKGSRWVELLPEGQARYSFIDVIGDRFYIWTDLNAPRGRIVAIDRRNPARANWQVIVPEGDDAIASVNSIGGRLVVEYLHDAYALLKLYDYSGTYERDVELPTLGSVNEVEGRRDDPEMFFSFVSFIFPETIYRYQFADQRLEAFRRAEVDFDASQYETRQVFCTSADGTQVPLFLTYRTNLRRNGQNPTLLYGYGGFTVNRTPFFSAGRTLWTEDGGIFAMAVLRGGSEYGEEWHRAGMLENKQNVFDDFVACAQWLIDSGYTSTPKLAIQGGSNGGLLVAACMVQRPDLFGAVVCGAPVIDMLRYHKFTVGRYWTVEYGNAEEKPDHFEFLYNYSPLHNIQQGVTYPATLITVADTDDRVVPMHGKKFAATLQANDSGRNPILIRIETKAGHGAGKPTTKVIDEQADIYAFLHRALRM